MKPTQEDINKLLDSIKDPTHTTSARREAVLMEVERLRFIKLSAESTYGEVFSLQDYKSNRSEQMLQLHAAINRVNLAIKQLRPSKEYSSIFEVLVKLELVHQQLVDHLSRLTSSTTVS